MTVTLRTALSLTGRRSVGVAAGIALLLGVAGGSLPLLEVPGYELGELGALLAVLVLGPWLGFAAARAERARPEPSPAAAWVAAAAAATVILSALLAGSVLRASFGPCRPLFAAAFFPALALPSALLATALAVACAFLARRGTAQRPGWRAGAGYAVVALLFLAARTVWVYRGPEAFLLDPLWGYFPGPLYDEALPLDPRLWLARAEAIGWAVAVTGAAGFAARPRRARGAAAMLAAGLGAGGLLWTARIETQGDPDLRGAITSALGGRLDGPRCTLVFPAEKRAAAARELLAECEFHAADVADALRISHPPRVTVFVYRSSEEKRRWVGAARTDYTKPWRAELQLDDEPLPHPVLRHEVVHAMAAALAPGPLHVPARIGVVPQLALIEGLAVALDTPRSGFTVHQWSRAARDLGYLPNLEPILGPAGFWSQAPARAYTAAGSFLGFLLARYGPGPVASAYADGDIARAIGRPLPALVAEWQRSLDAVPVTPELHAAARRWFGRGSLFERRCARESAALQRAAGIAAAEGRIADACRLYDREAAVGDTADALLAEARALLSAGALDRAAEKLALAAARVPPGDAGRAEALAESEGDLAWLRGAPATAVARWKEAAALPIDRSQARLLEVKAAAAQDPAFGPAARDYLLAPGDPLSLARVARSDRPLAAYLLGRVLLQRGERAAAGDELSRALRGGLPDLVALEARLSLAEARCDAGDEPLLAPLEAGSAADQARRAEAKRRCARELRVTPAAAASVPASPSDSSPRSGGATRSP